MNDKIRLIKTLLLTATKEHFKKLERICGDNLLYGYTLYTCDDATSVGPVANRSNDFNISKEDPMYSYYRYGAQEWELWDDFNLFTQVNKDLRSYVENRPEEDDFYETKEMIFKVFLEVLVELQNEGLFTNMAPESFKAVWVCDSDSEIMCHSAKLLNSEKVFDEYKIEF